MVNTIIGSSVYLGGVRKSFCNDVVLVLGSVGVIHLFPLLFNKHAYEWSFTVGWAWYWVLRIK